MLKADLHIHTKYSMDCSLELDKIIHRCQKLGINCIAIADHGTTEGALKMKSMAPFTVIVAEEVLTPHGEIMGMFLKETIPSGLPVDCVIAEIKAQGGLVCIPHPFDTVRGSALNTDILREIAGQIDVIEAFNARSPFLRSSEQARAFADKHGIIKGAGSDSHSEHEIGNAYIEMPEFKGKEDFLQALSQGKIVGHRTNPMTHMGTAWIKVKRFLREGNFK